MFNQKTDGDVRAQLNQFVPKPTSQTPSSKGSGDNTRTRVIRTGYSSGRVETGSLWSKQNEGEGNFSGTEAIKFVN